MDKSILNKDFIIINENKRAKRKYAKLKLVNWIDDTNMEFDEDDFETFYNMDDEGDYDGMMEFLARFKHNIPFNEKIYDNIPQHQHTVAENDKCILVTTKPGELEYYRPYGLYLKLTPEEVVHYEL